MDDVLAVCTDLYFQSRIASAATAAGRAVRFVKQTNDVAPFRLALVDLDAGTDVPAMIVAMRRAGSGSVIAFGPHLDTAGRQVARAAGAMRVLAKSKFVKELPRMMSDEDTTAQTRTDDILAELREYGERMQRLGVMLQDPASVRRLYFAPEAHMETALEEGEPIILDSADYMGFLAVDTLRRKIDRVREARAGQAPAGM